MLDTVELKTPAAWCRGRGLRFLPLRVGAEETVILFEPNEATLPWQRMKLILDDDGFRVCDELDDPLASASDLPALLDALDGGVAEPVRADAATFRAAAPILAQSLLL